METTMLLKMNPEHYRIIEQSIALVLAAYPNKRAEYTAQGLSPKRFRWDVFYAAKIDGSTSRWICDNLYPDGLNDNHIDSALRRIVGK